MLTVKELRKLTENLPDNAAVGIMKQYDPVDDVAEYEECVEAAVLPEEQGGAALILSAFATGIEPDEESAEDE